MRHLTAIMIVFHITRAAADPTAAQVAEADRLFQQGRALFDSGRAGEACPKFEESQRLDPGRGTLVNLAACHEAIGKLASALREFREVAELSRTAGDKKRLDTSAARATDLLKRVPRLTIAVGDGPRPEGFSLTVNSLPVSLAETQDMLVDPGKTVIVASAPKFAAFETSVTLQPDGGRTVVTVPSLAPEKPEQPIAAVVDTSEPRKQRTRVIIGTSVAAAGGVAVITASILALTAKRNYDSALSTECGGDPHGCTQVGYDQTHAAHSRGNVATVIGGVGLAAIAAGAIIWFTAPTERVPRPRIVPTTSPTGAGLAVVGTF